jgi:hypothetical protein
VLSVAGNLNQQAGGPPVPVQSQSDGEVTALPGTGSQRRSIYLQVRRQQPLTLLAVFDEPIMEVNCTRRGVSTVSSQALALLNSDFVLEEARIFAERVLKEKPADPASHAFLLALGRKPNVFEQRRLTGFLAEESAVHARSAREGHQQRPDDLRRQAVADLCQMLLSANEFIYVD